MNTPIEKLMDELKWTKIKLDKSAGFKRGLPVATHEAVLKIGDATIKCYLLDDGQRVLDADDVIRFFGAIADASDTET